MYLVASDDETRRPPGPMPFGIERDPAPTRPASRPLAPTHRSARPTTSSAPSSPSLPPAPALEADSDSGSDPGNRSPGVTTDDELAARVAPHLALLRRVAQRILGCPDQAQDAVQEAIVALWRFRGRPPELRGWLVRTVVHRSLHRRRSELRRQRWEDEAAIDHWAACPLCDPEDEVGRRELMAALENALARLSSEHRIVLALRSEGLEYEEIAERLALPVGTVRSRLNRARRALRERLPTDRT